MRYKVGERVTAKKCPRCNAEPTTGLVAEPMYDSWFFNCSKCGFAIKVDQQPD